MNDLLLNPGVQAGVLPALAAAAVAWILGSTRAQSAVVLAGLAVVVVVAVGFSLDPLTGRSKLVLAVALSAATALVMDFLDQPLTTKARVTLATLTGISALWIAQRVLQQRELAEALLPSIGTFLFAAATVEAARFVAGSSLKTWVCGLVTGFTVGALGLLGASASVAQMGIAIGASCGVAALVQLVSRRPDMPLRYLWLPIAVMGALAGTLVTFTGSLQAAALVPLPLIPLAICLAWRQAGTGWTNAMRSFSLALLPAIAAVSIGRALPASG